MMKESKLDIFCNITIILACLMCALAIAVVLSSCSTSKEIVKDHYISTTDTLRVYSRDTLYIDKYIHIADTVRDNTYVVIRLDSAGHETSRVETHDIYHGHSNDNLLSILQTKTDSVYSNKTDTIRVLDSKVITKEKNLSIWERLQIYASRIFFVMLIVMGGYLLFNKKFS